MSVNDLKDGAFVRILMAYRQKNWLKQLVAQCTESDRETIVGVMPLVVVDFTLKTTTFIKHAELHFLRASTNMQKVQQSLS